MSDFYVVYTKELAFKLRERGFKIVKTGINHNHPQYDTYIFKNSTALQNAIHEIIDLKKKNK